jgi:hypothetical protein
VQEPQGVGERRAPIDTARLRCPARPRPKAKERLRTSPRPSFTWSRSVGAAGPRLAAASEGALELRRSTAPARRTRASFFSCSSGTGRCSRRASFRRTGMTSGCPPSCEKSSTGFGRAAVRNSDSLGSAASRATRSTRFLSLARVGWSVRAAPPGGCTTARRT